MKSFRFKHFSLPFEWWMVLVLLFGVVLSADAIVTTCENIQTAAPWWHTAFTAVESVVFPAALVCLILKALQPARPERERFYFAVAFVACALITLRTAFSQYWQLFVEDDTHWLKWIIGPLAVIGWSCLTYFLGYCCAKAKGGKAENHKE